MVALSPFTNSARKVPLQTTQKAVLQAQGIQVDVPDIPKGTIQLYSYFKPGLLAGTYAIEAEQTITSNSEKWGTEQYQCYNRKRNKPDGTPNPDVNRTVPVTNPQVEGADDYAPQQFEVVFPQFNIDPKLIDSHYPPDGHQDESKQSSRISISLGNGRPTSCSMRCMTSTSMRTTIQLISTSISSKTPLRLLVRTKL
jgi:hypothetical protein